MREATVLIPDDLNRSALALRPAGRAEFALSGQTMGTSWSVCGFAPEEISEGDILRRIEDVFAAIIASMSGWDSGSTLSRFNRLPAGGRIAIDPMFSDVMQMALNVARRSGGVFDPCLGGDVIRSGFGPAACASFEPGTASGPSIWPQLLPMRGELVQPGGVTLDVSAIAKGYAVDAMAAAVAGFGITSLIAEIGGEFVGSGVKPDGLPWWVDIENPYPEGGPFRLALSDRALATSGDYRQQRQLAGAKVSHIVLPPGRVCFGGDPASVSVVHPSCALADAWATALFAAGDVVGLRMADDEKLAALFQYRDAPARLSAKMRAYLG